MECPGSGGVLRDSQLFSDPGKHRIGALFWGLDHFSGASQRVGKTHWSHWTTECSGLEGGCLPGPVSFASQVLGPTRTGTPGFTWLPLLGIDGSSKSLRQTQKPRFEPNKNLESPSDPQKNGWSHCLKWLVTDPYFCFGSDPETP